MRARLVACFVLEAGDVKYFGTLQTVCKVKFFSGVFRQYGRRVRVGVKITVRFRSIYVGDPTCSHRLAV